MLYCPCLIVGRRLKNHKTSNSACIFSATSMIVQFGGSPRYNRFFKISSGKPSFFHLILKLGSLSLFFHRLSSFLFGQAREKEKEREKETKKNTEKERKKEKLTIKTKKSDKKKPLRYGFLLLLLLLLLFLLRLHSSLSERAALRFSASLGRLRRERMGSRISRCKSVLFFFRLCLIIDFCFPLAETYSGLS